MANSNLTSAKNAKNDEFYTQYHDIETEINAYLEYDPNVFQNKTVLLPCDDPEWSNFTKFFAQNFERLKLKKLISTSFAPDSKNLKINYQPTLFEKENPKFDEEIIVEMLRFNSKDPEVEYLNKEESNSLQEMLDNMYETEYRLVRRYFSDIKNEKSDLGNL